MDYMPRSTLATRCMQIRRVGGSTYLMSALLYHDLHLYMFPPGRFQEGSEDGRGGVPGPPGVLPLCLAAGSCGGGGGREGQASGTRRSDLMLNSLGFIFLLCGYGDLTLGSK